MRTYQERNDCIFVTYIACCIPLMLGLIIGIPTMVKGCDTNLPICLKYENVDKKILQTQTISQQYNYCSSWSSIDQNTTCMSWQNYTYWKNNIIFDSCFYPIEKSFTFQNEAVEYARVNYINGSNMRVSYLKTTPHICEIITGSTKDNAIAGIFFLSLALLSCVFPFINHILITIIRTIMNHF